MTSLGKVKSFMYEDDDDDSNNTTANNDMMTVMMDMSKRMVINEYRQSDNQDIYTGSNQYIKDCEAGAGRTPSVRRRK